MWRGFPCCRSPRKHHESSFQKHQRDDIQVTVIQESPSERDATLDFNGASLLKGISEKVTRRYRPSGTALWRNSVRIWSCFSPAGTRVEGHMNSFQASTHPAKTWLHQQLKALKGPSPNLSTDAPLHLTDLMHRATGNYFFSPTKIFSLLLYWQL